MNWLIINLKDTPTGRKLITWSWTNAVQIQKEKKKIKEKNELKREKWDVEKKSSVMKIEHYSKTCWSREEEARYLQLQRHKLRAFKNTSVFKNMEKFILSLDQIVWWVMGSFEFLTRDYFFLFVDWTRVVWATRVSGQWYRSMIVMVFLVPDRRSCSPMLYLKLNVLSCLGCFWRHLCSEMDKVESRCSCSAPFPDFGLVISMMKNWFT